MPSYLTRSGQPQWIGTEPFTREQRNAAGQAIEDRLLVAGIGLRAARPAPAFERQEYHATDTGELFRTREISGAPGTFEWRLLNPVQDVSGLLERAVVDVKGDLLVGTANDTVGRLAAGSNRRQLLADSAQAAGLRYGTDPMLGGYDELTVTTATSGTVTLDLGAANVFLISPTSTVAIAFSNAAAGGNAMTAWTIRFAHSNNAVTWPVATRFPDGLAPVLSGITYVSGVTLADGTPEILGVISGLSS